MDPFGALLGKGDSNRGGSGQKRGEGEGLWLAQRGFCNTGKWGQEAHEQGGGKGGEGGEESFSDWEGGLFIAATKRHHMLFKGGEKRGSEGCSAYSRWDFAKERS